MHLPGLHMITRLRIRVRCCGACADVLQGSSGGTFSRLARPGPVVVHTRVRAHTECKTRGQALLWCTYESTHWVQHPRPCPVMVHLFGESARNESAH
eukprot:395681-Pelagomonas_calceolata.AAC.1